MGLFDVFKKQDCEICGKEVGMFGYKKLEDGEICKDCVKKLSPWFEERRHSTVEQIKQQLTYREQNRVALSGFHPTLSFGENYELKVELADGVPNRFVVAQTDSYLEENADLIGFSQVSSFNIEIDDRYRELKYRNPEGEMVSYSPRRYEYSYDFYAEIHVNSPWFDKIRFRLNRNTLDLETISQGFSVFSGASGFDPMHYPEYRQYKSVCDELEQVFRLGAARQPMPGYTVPATSVYSPAAQSFLASAAPPAPPVQSYAAPAPAPAPAPAGWQCPACGSANSGKFCASCGTPKPQAPAVCPGCGAPVSGGKFCPSCGTPL